MKFTKSLLTFSVLSVFSVAAIATPFEKDCEFSAPNGVNVDLAKYTGGWYEIESSYAVSNTIEKGCKCNTVYYSLNETNSDHFDVSNTCIRNHEFFKIQGYAVPDSDEDKPSGNLRVSLPVQAPLPNSANYIILNLWKDENLDYTHALVGGDKDGFWWIISRSPWYNETVVNESYEILHENMYDLKNSTRNVQSCTFSGGHKGTTLVETN